MPRIATVQALTVAHDLSGGVKIGLGAGSCVLSPQQAIEFAAAILKTAGCNVNFDNPVTPLLRMPSGPMSLS